MTLKKTIAIIHRDEPLINTLAEMAQYDYNVSTMLVNRNTSPVQVSYFIDENTPDLVLLAENYRGWPDSIGEKMGEGIEALTEIRKNYPKDQLPVFMVSGNPQYKERAMESGANGYLPIPIGLKDYKEFLKSNLQ